jgi:hypothetical protein
MNVWKNFKIARENFTGFTVSINLDMYSELKLGDKYRVENICKGYRGSFYFNMTKWINITSGKLCARNMRVARIINRTKLHSSDIEKTGTFAGVPLSVIGMEQIDSLEDQEMFNFFTKSKL